MIVNVYAENRGWLFEDLKEAFKSWALRYSNADDGPRPFVVPTNDPLPKADAWICLRTNELDRSPDLARTICQVHDLWERDLEHRKFGALSLVHEAQKHTVHNWEALIPGICLPIGARRAFTLRDSMPEHFTAGWTGRNMIRGGQSIKRPHLLAEAAAEVGCRVIALTPNTGLGPNADYWRPDRGHRRTPSLEQLQKFYESIDVLVVTSLPEPGPLSIFEALRCGVPVVTMSDGPQHPLGLNIHKTGDSSHDLAAWLRDVGMPRREAMFHNSSIRRECTSYLQEGWIAANIKLAVEVAA